MVTSVSFLLTIFTKFRQLKTNLQALCCLTERIKKGKPTIKVTAEVFSRGLRRAPAEPWTEAPAGATGVPQPGSAGWQRLRAHSHSSTARNHPTTRLLKGCRGEEQNSQAEAHTPSHLPCSATHGARGQPLRSTPFLLRKHTAPRKMFTEKKEKAERKNWHVVRSMVISR